MTPPRGQGPINKNRTLPFASKCTECTNAPLGALRFYCSKHSTVFNPVTNHLNNFHVNSSREIFPKIPDTSSVAHFNCYSDVTPCPQHILRQTMQMLQICQKSLHTTQTWFLWRSGVRAVVMKYLLCFVLWGTSRIKHSYWRRLLAIKGS